VVGELTAFEIDELLRSQLVGRIGCHAGGETYVVPITYVYEDDVLYCHSMEGRKLRMMRENPRVCFEVDKMDSLASWRSVIAWGTFEELSSEDAGRAMRYLMTRLMPLAAGAHGTPTHALFSSGSLRVEEAGDRAVFFRIRLDTKTGRYEGA
jgi:nitroimidazol reductase NimA-like FMN-containing flavoprotein (pyridoxamine 5'-phosphate oxidase superfamily)